MRSASSIGLGQKHVSRTKTRPKDILRCDQRWKPYTLFDRSITSKRNHSAVRLRATYTIELNLVCRLLHTDRFESRIFFEQTTFFVSFLCLDFRGRHPSFRMEIFFQKNWFLRKIAVEDREATDSAIRSLKECKYQNLLEVLAGNLKIQQWMRRGMGML